MLADDLESLGVSPYMAKQFTAATAVPAPTLVSENGKGMSGGGGTAQATTYQTVDGGSLTEAELQALIAKSKAANPQASQGGYEGVGTTSTPGPDGQTTYGTSASILAGGDPTGTQFNWQSYLVNWGFPTEVTDQLAKIFQSYSDPSQAQAAALAYIRGTDWYAQTFPGIQAGEKAGLFGDEAGYRAYINDANQYYRRYLGRDLTSQEAIDALTGGKSATALGQHLEGQAYIAANRGDFQYDLGAFDPNGQATEDQLNALGDEQAGLGNSQGQDVQNRIEKAKQRLGRIFQGTLATPALSVLNSGQVTSSSLSGRPTDYAS